MKVALVTTLASLEENKRIEEEVKKKSHEFELINTKDFGFRIKNNKLTVEKLTGLKADIVILRGIFNSIKSLAEVVKHLRYDGMRVFDNNLLEHKYSINKIADIIKLSLSELPIPDTYYGRTFDEYLIEAKRIGYPVIVKLTRTGKGYGVRKIDNERKLKELIKEVEKGGGSAKSYLMQEFVDYEHDLRVLVIGEEVYCMKRIPGKGEFRANFSLGGEVKVFELNDEDKYLALKAMRAMEMDIGGVDILIGKNGKRYLLEVNHTAGMVGMEKATGENITKKYVDYAIRYAK